MTTLQDALSDCLTDHRKLGKIDFAAIAADYLIHPDLLERKYHEQYRSGEPPHPGKPKKRVLAVGKAVESRFARRAKNIKLACQRFKVAPETVTVRKVRGLTMTVICCLPNERVRPYVAINHEDGKAYRVTI